MDDLWKPIFVPWCLFADYVTRVQEKTRFDHVRLQGGGSDQLDDMQVVGMLPPSL